MRADAPSPVYGPPASQHYRDLSELCGPAITPTHDPAQVRYRRVGTRGERIVLVLFIAFNACAAILFLAWLVRPANVPAHENTLPVVAAIVGMAVLVAIEVLRLAQNATICLFAWQMRDPVPMVPAPGLRVAVLTTIVPSKEPLELVARTLAAMRAITYRGGSVDVWILDEGDDPAVKRAALRLGVRHFSRKGRPEYNQSSGAYRARTKCGNHNAWRAEHEHEYDIVAQMDPDHVPGPDFLERSLGYFRDPDVAFVVAPQVYDNIEASFVALGASEQQYIFNGVIQRGANGMNVPLLIGTNHLYRTATWSQIGGYQDSIIEDHLTGLLIHTTINPATGRRWKGVSIPDILSVGEGPHTWTDYLNQQRRWAYGMWDVILKHSWRLYPKLTLRQRVAYTGLQLFYPSLGFTWLAGNVLTVTYLLTGVTAIRLQPHLWGALWGATVMGQWLMFLWLRRFNVAPHERRGIGASGSLLALAAGPGYCAAAVTAVLRRPLTYIVTAKGQSASPDTVKTFQLHIFWGGLLALSLLASGLLGHTFPPLRVWGVFTVAACSLPLIISTLARRQTAMAWRFSSKAAYAPFVLLLAVMLAALLYTTPPQAVSDWGEIAAPPVADGPVAGLSPTAAGAAPVAFPGTSGLAPAYGRYGDFARSQTGVGLRHHFVQWKHSPRMLGDLARASQRSNQVLLLSWEPRSGPILPEPRPEDVAILAEIAAGRHDAYIRAVAIALRETRAPVIIRFAHEMERPTDGLHPWAGQPPERYITAYQRVVDIFRREQVTNVRWLWSPAGMTAPDGLLTGVRYYPGDAYADYTGFSAFLWWGWEERDPRKAATHSYQTPEELIGPRTALLALYGKPVIIPELGIDLHPSLQGARQAWLAEAAEGIAKGRFPGLAAVVYFDGPHNFADEDADWRLTMEEEAALRLTLARR